LGPLCRDTKSYAFPVKSGELVSSFLHSRFLEEGSIIPALLRYPFSSPPIQSSHFSQAANVLLSSSDMDRRGFVAKVSDFGLSRVLAGNRKEIKTQTFGTVTHMPPELLSKGILSPSADVYAMGVLLWEAYSGDRVFKQLSDSEVILAVVTRKARPQFPPDTPHRFKYLAERCWAELPEVRPSLQQLYNELENLQAQLCPQGPESPRLLLQSCIKQKRSVSAVPPVQMAGAKGPGQQSRLAQGVSTDGTAKGGSTALPKGVYTSTPGREYNSGGGHLYVNSPLGVGAGSVASHGPSQADKLKTFAALNRTQQSAKKSSEYGNGPPSANGYGSPVPGGSGGAPSMTGGPSGASPRHLGAAAAIGPGGPRPLMKVPSLHKARECIALGCVLTYAYIAVRQGSDVRAVITPQEHQLRAASRRCCAIAADCAAHRWLSSRSS
ncbi:hypothetical protein Vafri_4913, partial [Volvox africanus]